jgi:hypothetical protein
MFLGHPAPVISGSRGQLSPAYLPRLQGRAISPPRRAGGSSRHSCAQDASLTASAAYFRYSSRFAIGAVHRARVNPVMRCDRSRFRAYACDCSRIGLSRRNAFIPSVFLAGRRMIPCRAHFAVNTRLGTTTRMGWNCQTTLPLGSGQSGATAWRGRQLEGMDDGGHAGRAPGIATSVRCDRADPSIR